MKAHAAMAARRTCIELNIEASIEINPEATLEKNLSTNLETNPGAKIVSNMACRAFLVRVPDNLALCRVSSVTSQERIAVAPLAASARSVIRRLPNSP
jgi:hypothetical protein